ncbi:histidinol-phosphate transaminase [Nocardioides mangrovicus]|uniref:Aromatic amino acid aminotransferase n=1 Tax=Nocardioides mangrovicus TaxID=2478913 RepID=A0A3L8P042_9ACTN|nr:histidinol-phosphate transaminase [Nocardioides mangrovicus]RLV47929.1 histidinol-phosphate transaminase [Nocardioides mangrovicus]
MTTPPRPRQVIADLPAYVPGRPPAARPGVRTYKLSSNENPYPPLPGIEKAATEALGTLNRYPDMGCTALYAALADRLGVGADELAAGTGSVAVLYHLLQAYCDPGDEVVHAWRSFEAYPIAVTVTGARSVRVPLTSGAEHDVAAMAAAVTDRTKVVVVCTPNNPTGPALTHDELTWLVERVPEHVLVVVDEAYREFVRLPSAADGLALQRTRANVVVMRTLAKAYGLAGLRVGYAVAHPEVAAAVRACALPFGVSSVAQAAAIAALDHEPELMERVEAIVAERDRVLATLRAQGWAVPDTQANFVWLPLGERTPAFAAAAEEAGVVVRPFPEGARVSIGEPAGNDVLLDVAARFGPV